MTPSESAAIPLDIARTPQRARDKIKSIRDLAAIASALKSRGKTIVLAHGVFDLVHMGHVRHLEAAAAEGLTLYVHNHTGEFDNRFLYDHGDGKPVMTSAWEIVAANTDPRFVQFEIDVFWARLAFKPDRFDDLLAFLESQPTAHRNQLSHLERAHVSKQFALFDQR